MTAYYKEHAAVLQGLGYPILPIERGQKRPAGSIGWRNKLFNPRDPRFQGDGYGVGIQCGIELPDHSVIVGIDVDFLHEGVVKALTKWVFENIAVAPIRIGLPPKRLLVFRMLEPGTSKMFSAGFTQAGVLDAKGKRAVQKVEILGDGQQFVAYGLHPDSGKDYSYPGFEFAGQRFDRAGLVSVMADDLPMVDESQLCAICAAVSDIVKAFPELTEIKPTPTKGVAKPNKAPDEDGVVSFDVPCSDITLANAETYLQWYDPESADAYDSWVMIGMALHCQFGGADAALELWDSWSQNQPGYVDADDLASRWRGFGAEKQSTVTFKSVIKRYVEYKKADRVKQRAAREAEDRELLRLVNECADQQKYSELLEDVIPKIRKHLTPEDKDRVLLFKGALRKAVSKAAGCTIKWTEKELHQRLFPRQGEVSEALAALNQDQEYWKKRAPPWARGWVYVSTEEIFVNPSMQKPMKAVGFDNHMAQYLHREEGEMSPPRASSHLLSNGLIPVAHRRVYWPGKPWLFLNGVKGIEVCYNTFNPGTLTEPLDSLDDCSLDDIEAIELFKRHVCLLLNGTTTKLDRDGQILVSWLRHQFEFPGKKIRWTPLLVSAERAGKSYFSSCLLQSLLGGENVKPLSAAVILNSAKTSFNEWSFGACVAAIEELHITGANRHEVMNFLKDKQTNDEISCHPKGGAVFKAANTQNYIAYSNYHDAIPVGEDSARWFVLLCAGTERKARSIDPLYFDKLFALTKSNSAAIGRWLLEQPYHAEFNPEGSAPPTAGRRIMASITSAVDGSQNHSVEELIAESMSADVGPDVVHAGSLEEIANSRRTAGRVSTRAIALALHELGYSYSGLRVRLPDGRRFRPWVRGFEGYEDSGALERWVVAKIQARSLAFDAM